MLKLSNKIKFKYEEEGIVMKKRNFLVNQLYVWLQLVCQ